MNGRINRPSGIVRLMLDTLARRLPTRRRARQTNPLDELNDFYLRDIGFWRERSAGPRRYDPWM